MAKEVIKLSELSQEERKQFRDKYDYIFFDMDGTLEQINNDAIPGVPEAVSAIAACGKKIYVLTDTCLHSRDNIAKKLQKHFPFIDEDCMVSAGFLIAEKLRRSGFNKKIYVLGQEEGIVKELKLAGFEVISDRVTGDYYTVHDIKKVQMDPEVGAVVVAADINFSYMKLLKAVNYLINPDVLFLTSQSYTNVSYPGRLILPAAGALARPIAAITKREPTPFNKGCDAPTEYIQSLGFDMKRCLFVGDALLTDIQCGNKCGMDTLLVLCGISTEEELQQRIAEKEYNFIPTYVTDSTADLKLIYS